MQKIYNLPPEYRITGLYLLVGMLWILFSDMVLGWMVEDVQTMQKLQTFKGWFYVSVTALLFFFLIRRAFRKTNEVKKTLREAVEHYSYLFKNNPHPMWVFDCEKLKPVEANVAALKVYGFSNQEFLDLDLSELFQQEDPEELKQTLDKNAPEFHRSSGFRIRKKNGLLIDVELITHLLPSQNGGCLRLVLAMDITGHKQAFEALKASEAALQESERQLTTLLGNLPGLAYRCLNDKDWTMLIVSKGCKELTGYPSEALENNKIISYGEIIHPSDRQRVYDEVQEKLFHKKPYPLIYRIITAHGQVKWVWEQAVGILNEEGNLLFIEGFISDITEQRDAQKALNDQNELLRRILQNLSFPVLYKDLKGHILDCNHDFCDYIGKPYEQIIGKTAWDLLPNQQARIIEKTDKKVLSSMSDYREEQQLVYADGRVIDSVFQKSLFFNAEGLPQGFIEVYFDISERVKAEKIIKKQLKDLERINSELEYFTYTVSHDLRSPLVTINGSLNLLREDIKSNDLVQIDEGLQRISSATKRMHNLLENLLHLSRIGRVSNPLSNFSMFEVASEVKSYLHGILQESSATLQIKELPEVYGDRSRISQVLQNLVENAVKFRQPERELFIEIGCRNQNGQNIFYVSDNGIGIDPGQLESVFIMFRKLDSGRDGTGLGLALVKRIVEFHGGRVWAESEGPESGATFCFTLGEPSTPEN